MTFLFLGLKVSFFFLFFLCGVSKFGVKFLEQVGNFFIFGSKSSLFIFTSRWEAFFCEKLKKEEPFFFLIFFAFCRYCADCSSKLPYIRVFLKKFDGIFFFFD